MSVERDIRFDLIARLCPNTTGAELRSVATEVGLASSPFDLLTAMENRRACLQSVHGGRWLRNVTF
jgi:ATP-dependent 26S proteasome regulatory subunit